jgi:hypothetical protein
MPRKFKCPICGEPFEKERPFQKCCSIPCAIEMGRSEKQKKEKKELRARKAALKTRAQWAKEAQAAFNAYIRARDCGQPCISCGRFHTGQIHAGHYLSVGAHPELRFNEDNVHAQCRPCNEFLSGNIVNYRPRLIDKIGLERVEILEGPHDPVKHTIDELKEIKRVYSLKTKELKGVRNG